jgi:hypothetical protein
MLGKSQWVGRIAGGCSKALSKSGDGDEEECRNLFEFTAMKAAI